MTFAEWLYGVVRKHDLSVDTDSSRDRVGTWSERLAFAMEEGAEYDSFLRRIANGKVSAPGPAVTYRIGRGLYAGGLTWCSGALALLRNPRTFKDALAVVDIASRAENSHNVVAFWYFLATAKVFELPGSGLDADEITVVLDLLTTATSNIALAMDSAFAEYQKRGMRAAHGFLGDAYFISSDKRISRAADIAAFARRQWLIENRFDGEYLNSLLAKSIRTGFVTQAPSTNTRPKKAG